jgi:hypothetical protein
MAQRREAGLCRRCGAPCETDTEWSLCLKHWLQTLSGHNTGMGRYGWKMLKEIFEEQGRRCAYTGVPLIPGRNASVDHKTPKGRGGTDNRENLQWVCSLVNAVKRNLTHEEFVALCNCIAERFPKERKDQEGWEACAKLLTERNWPWLGGKRGSKGRETEQ